MLQEQFAHMASGAMYNDLAPELNTARARARHAAQAYDDAYGQPQEQRERLLRELLGSVGAEANFEPTLRCEFGVNISVGARFWANYDCVMLDGARITIGDDVLFGPRVALYTVNHALDRVERAAAGCRAEPITLGDGVWVGGGSTILPGVTVGVGAVIGAGSVVTRDVPGGTIAAGNPARVLREIGDDDRSGYQP